MRAIATRTASVACQTTKSPIERSIWSRNRRDVSKSDDGNKKINHWELTLASSRYGGQCKRPHLEICATDGMLRLTLSATGGDQGPVREHVIEIQTELVRAVYMPSSISSLPTFPSSTKLSTAASAKASTSSSPKQQAPSRDLGAGQKKATRLQPPFASPQVA